MILLLFLGEFLAVCLNGFYALMEAKLQKLAGFIGPWFLNKAVRCSVVYSTPLQRLLTACESPVFEVGLFCPEVRTFLPLSTRYFIPVTIENRTCDISSATIGTLFLCCVRV